MGDNQNGRKPKWKATKMEDNQNCRQPKLKTTTMEYEKLEADQNGR